MATRFRGRHVHNDDAKHSGISEDRGGSSRSSCPLPELSRLAEVIKAHGRQGELKGWIWNSRGAPKFDTCGARR